MPSGMTATQFTELQWSETNHLPHLAESTDYRQTFARGGLPSPEMFVSSALNNKKNTVPKMELCGLSLQSGKI